MTSSGREKGRHRPLDPEDEALWAHTTRSLEPLRKAKSRVVRAAEERTPSRRLVPDERLPGSAEPSSRPRSGPRAPAGPVVARSGSETPVRAPPALQPFDAKRAKRLRGGRADIEDRIDLHGLRQHEAHIALRRFLVACHADGLRLVLVITGKGAPRGAGEAPDGSERLGDRGVLRQSVPRWLAEPDLAAIVVSVAEASQRHGGAGAYYVHLRSRARARTR